MQVVVVIGIHVRIHVVVFGMFSLRVHVRCRQMARLEIRMGWMIMMMIVAAATAAGYYGIRNTRI